MKVDDVEAEKEDTDDQWTDEETDMRDIVLALPALRITSERVSVRSVVTEEGEEEARMNEQAVVAAQLVLAAAEEAVMKEKSDGKKKKTPKKMKKLQDIPDGSGGSGKGLVVSKNPKKKRGSELTNPPEGPPACKICGRGFGSWKAVFGHMRSHKDRNYQGFLPPHKFSAVAERFSIPGLNSSFVLVTAGGGSSGCFVTSGGGGGGGSGGEGGRDLGFDLNVELVEEDDNQEVTESGDISKFDLNKSPPNNEEEEEKVK